MTISPSWTDLWLNWNGWELKRKKRCGERRGQERREEEEDTESAIDRKKLLGKIPEGWGET